MGIDWDDKEQFAFGMLVVPDGRIVCQRPADTASFVRKWQATVYRKVPRLLTSNAAACGDTAYWALDSIFSVNRKHVEITYLTSHFVAEMNKRLELVICKLQSSGKLYVGNHIEVRLFTFENLLAEIEKDKKPFAPSTIHAVNVIDTMTSWRHRANEIAG